MNTQTCTHCGSPNIEDRGPQKGVELATRRWFSYPLYQCLNPGCETSFGIATERRYLDDGSPVPVTPKPEMAVVS
jgi:hypothetical protein